MKGVPVRGPGSPEEAGERGEGRGDSSRRSRGLGAGGSSEVCRQAGEEAVQ